MAKKKKRVLKKKLPDFDKSFADLEAVVRKLEQGDLGLTDSLEQYEQGVRHLKNCYQALEQAEQKIELLTGIDQQGNPRVRSFAEVVEDSAADEKSEADSERPSLFDELED